MPRLCCPVCGEALWEVGRTLHCGRGHSYDISKYGYVNLLMSNRASSKRHGDDREMVLARQAFLEKGFYLPLRDEVCRLAVKYCPEGADLIDAGCGEGWYTAAVRDALGAKAVGADISKDALREAARRGELTLAVASVSRLPVMDGSCDLVLSVFAPDAPEEFRRVLRPGGVLIRAVPLEEHLMGLKRAVYERPYPNPPAVYAPEGFELIERRELRFTMELEGGDITSLFKMTPYYYKTGREDQMKLMSLDKLVTEAAFCVFVMRKL